MNWNSTLFYFISPKKKIHKWPKTLPISYKLSLYRDLQIHFVFHRISWFEKGSNFLDEKNKYLKFLQLFWIRSFEVIEPLGISLRILNLLFDPFRISDEQLIESAGSKIPSDENGRREFGFATGNRRCSRSVVLVRADLRGYQGISGVS